MSQNADRPVPGCWDSGRLKNIKVTEIEHSTDGTVLRRADLDKILDKGGGNTLCVRAGCHREAPVLAVYSRQEKTIEFFCAICESSIVTIAVADDEPPTIPQTSPSSDGPPG